jgi:hypothetical protein
MTSGHFAVRTTISARGLLAKLESHRHADACCQTGETRSQTGATVGYRASETTCFAYESFTVPAFAVAESTNAPQAEASAGTDDAQLCNVQDAKAK